MKYYFKDVKLNSLFRIIFLCGVSFENKEHDKRRVLKKYLEESKLNKVLIIEEYFSINGDDDKLYYNDIDLTSLFEIESLTAFMADLIFIIQESLSTSAELGVFASNKRLTKKICLITPNEINVEENKISEFINLAFIKESIGIHNIEFYPVVQQNRVSNDTSNYYTRFLNNQIGKNLANNIERFIEKNTNNTINLYLKKVPRNNNNSNYKNYYRINNSKKRIMFYTDYNYLKYYIISLFSIPEFRREIRKKNNIKDSVKVVFKWYIEILKNTISEKEGKDARKYGCTFEFPEENISSTTIQVAIAYILYVLHALEFIILPNKSESLVIKQQFKNYYSKIECIVEKSKYKNLGEF